MFVEYGGQYHFNRAWALFRLNKYKTDLAHSDIYIRLVATSPVTGTLDSVTAYTGKNLALYNPIEDKYIPYDKAHLGLLGNDNLVYYKYENGYYKYDKPNSDPAPLSELYKLDGAGNYVPATSITDDTIQLYFKHSGVSTGMYYFVSTSDSAIDPSLKGTQNCKMVGCAPVLKKDNSGEYKLFDNQLSKINSGEVYSGQRYSVLHGAVVDYASAGSDFLTSEVKSVSEASLRLLSSLAKKRANMNNLNSIMSNLTLEELFDLPPNSIFAHPDLKTSTLTNLPDKFRTLMSNMTIGDLCNYGEYTIDGTAFNSLSNVKIDKFMRALKVNDSGLYIDHDELFKP